MKVVYKTKPFHIDERGEMFYLLDKETKITSAILITSKKGSIRANHFHKKDIHYCHMIKGKMEYTYKKLKSLPRRQAGQISNVKTVIVNKGETVCTPTMTIHAMRFLEDSVFIALTTESRNQKKYEKDTVRTKIIK